MKGSQLLSLLLVVLAGLPSAFDVVRSLSPEEPWLELGWEGVVEQYEPNYCGPAVIATLLAREGVQVSAAEVAEEAELQPGGMSLAEFGRVAELHGFAGSWFSVPDETVLNALPLPAVVHLTGTTGHFAVLERELDGFVQLADPARGRVLLEVGRFEREWTRRIFLFRALPQG
ncbi:MAG TPA: cysteine peptidase family C39 domain-containing protein [Trueperaceae bacterium]